MIAAEVGCAARSEDDAAVGEVQLDRVDVVVIGGPALGVGDQAAVRAPAHRRRVRAPLIVRTTGERPQAVAVDADLVETKSAGVVAALAAGEEDAFAVGR